MYNEQWLKDHNINPAFNAHNVSDTDGNPTGGVVSSVGLQVVWQNGPRGVVSQPTEENPDAEVILADPNGAFVEDVIYAAIQRLEYFEKSKYKHPKNAKAIEHLTSAIKALKARSSERKKAGTLGKHEV